MRIFDTFTPLDEIVPVFEIRNGTIIYKDGRVALGFEVRGFEVENPSHFSLESLNDTFHAALKGLPEGMIVQKIDIYYHLPYQQPNTAEKAETGYFSKKQRAFSAEKKVLYQKSYLFFSMGLKEAPAPNALTNLFSLNKPLVKNAFEQIEKREIDLVRHAKSFVNEMPPHLKFEALNDDALEKRVVEHFNLSFAGRNDAINRDFYIKKDALVLGEKTVKILSMNEQGVLGDSIESMGVDVSLLSPLGYEMYVPHVVSTSILIQDTEKGLKKLDFERKMNRTLGFLTTQDNELKELELAEFTGEVRALNHKLVSLNVSVIFFSIDPLLLEEHVEKGVASFKKMNGAGAFTESWDTANLFCSLCPGNSYQNFRWIPSSSFLASFYLNFSRPYQSAAEGELLCDRYGNPMKVATFNPGLNNQNAIVIGPTGSGKSFTMGYLMAQRHEQGHKQIIIDVGGTYKSAVMALGGRYYEYNPESPIQFNPFLIDRDETGKYLLTGDKSNFLTSLLCTLWKGTKGKTNPVELSVFAKILPTYFNYYTQGGFAHVPALWHFHAYLKDYDRLHREEIEYQKILKSFDMDAFLITLDPFVSGQYKEILNADTYEDISGHALVCFDMDKVKGNTLLYPVVGMLLTELSLDQIRRFPTSRKYFYMDEAWSMLSGEMETFIETAFRTIRKNNGSMCIITQGIRELLASPIAGAIIVNANTRIILNHTDRTEIALLCEKLGFTDHEQDKINALRVHKDWREVFIKQGDEGKIYRLEACPEMVAILTSKPSERNRLRDLQERYGGNIHYAIMQFVEEKLSNSE